MAASENESGIPQGEPSGNAPPQEQAVPTRLCACRSGAESGEATHDEGVVEGGEEAADAPDDLSLASDATLGLSGLVLHLGDISGLLGLQGSGGGSGISCQRERDREETGRAQRSAQGGARARSSPLRTGVGLKCVCKRSGACAARGAHTILWRK